MHREALLVGIETWPACDGPALHHAVEFKPQIIVKTPSRVLLENVLMSPGNGFTTARLGGHGKTALFAVNLESHPASTPNWPAFLGG
jgi:hypothetical protein